MLRRVTSNSLWNTCQEEPLSVYGRSKDVFIIVRTKCSVWDSKAHYILFNDSGSHYIDTHKMSFLSELWFDNKYYVLCLLSSHGCDFSCHWYYILIHWYWYFNFIRLLCSMFPFFLYNKILDTIFLIQLTIFLYLRLLIIIIMSVLEKFVSLFIVL